MSLIEFISLENDCEILFHSFSRVWNDRLYEYCTFLSKVSMDQSFLHNYRAIKLLRIMCGKDNYTYREIRCQGSHLSDLQFGWPFESSSAFINTMCNSLLNKFIIQQESKIKIESTVPKQLNGFSSEDRIVILQSLWNLSEHNWQLHRLLESIIEEAPKYFEDIILSIVEELVEKKNDVEQLWQRPHHIKIIIACAQSKKLFLYVVNILSRITLFCMLNSKQSFLLISIMKDFITHVKTMCNNMNFDFCHLFPSDLQALVLLLEIDLELYENYLLPYVKKLLHDKLKAHSLSCFALFTYYRDWLFHLNNTNVFYYI